MNLVQLLTPTNLAAEKAAFFASKTYHPTFEYRWNEPEVLEWIKTHPEHKDFFEALSTQNTQEILKNATRFFDTAIEPELLEYAQKTIASPPQLLQTPAVSEIAHEFQRAFDQLGLSEYRLEIVDQHGFNFRPVAKDKKIVMSAHLHLDFFSVDGEVKHELAHIIRAENGIANNIKPQPTYLSTEEGLATYCQDYVGENGSASLFQHAAEYAMTPVALESSLRDVIEYLQEHGFSLELAWQRAVRHKFGFIDSSQAGDIMKPSMYFYHQQKVKALTSDERYRLFVGKIPISQLVEYPSYQGRIPYQVLQEFYPWS